MNQPRARGVRTAFTAVEVIVAVAILALAIVPLLMSQTSSEKVVRLTEYHVIAQTRAKRLLEAFSTYGLEGLRKAAGGNDGLLAPPLSGDETAGFDLPPEYQRKMENFREQFELQSLGPDLGLVKVTIVWTINGVEHDYELSRMVASDRSSSPPAPPLRGGEP